MGTETGTGVRLPAFIIVLWLAGVALLADAWLMGTVFMLPGVLALGLCIRQARRNEWGAVAAWAACSLAPLACLGILALDNVHLHEFTGSGPGCDYMAQDCSPNLPEGAAHALSLLLFTVAAIATLRLIAASRRFESEGV